MISLIEDDGDFEAFESDPTVESLHEAISLGELADGIDDFSIHEAEIAGVGWDFYGGGLVEEPVVESYELFFDEGFAGAVGLDAKDHFVSVVPMFEKGFEVGDGFLKIGIDDDDGRLRHRMDAQRNSRHDIRSHDAAWSAESWATGSSGSSGIHA